MFFTNFNHFSAGWNAPRNSTQLVYPDGLNKGATDDELNISFEPSPNYSKLAEAAAAEAGWLKGMRGKTVKEMRGQLVEALKHVQSGRGAVVEALMEK
jgi:hypothetical protein